MSTSTTESTTLYRGVDYIARLTSTLTDDAGVVTDDVLTGHTFEAQVRDKTGALVVDLSDYFSLVTGVPEAVDIDIPAADTWDIPAGRYQWDVLAVSAGGVKTFLVPTEPFIASTPATRLS